MGRVTSRKTGPCKVSHRESNCNSQLHLWSMQEKEGMHQKSEGSTDLLYFGAKNGGYTSQVMYYIRNNFIYFKIKMFTY